MSIPTQPEQNVDLPLACQAENASASLGQGLSPESPSKIAQPTEVAEREREAFEAWVRVYAPGDCYERLRWLPSLQEYARGTTCDWFEAWKAAARWKFAASGGVTGDDARRLILEGINPPAPTQELIDLMKKRVADEKD